MEQTEKSERVFAEPSLHPNGWKRACLPPYHSHSGSVLVEPSPSFLSDKAPD